MCILETKDVLLGSFGYASAASIPLIAFKKRYPKYNMAIPAVLNIITAGLCGLNYAKNKQKVCINS